MIAFTDHHHQGDCTDRPPSYDTSLRLLTPMSTFLGNFPPTPAPSIHSAFDLETNKEMSGYTSPGRVYDQSGPSFQQEPHYFPPTPPSLSDSPTRSDPPYPHQLPNELHFTEGLRNRRTRRPASVVTPINTSDRPPFLPPRKYTDPTPRSRSFLEESEELSPQIGHQLDVDLDAYSTTDYDEAESRAPTLSFVTTSTVESTTSTPPPGVYGAFKADGDGKEPRIRMRTTTGRANAYSSAESSMGSGAYSYHSYNNDHVYHPHPPPLPAIPLAYAQEVGLGIGNVPSRILTSPTETSSSGLPPSPTSYQHRPWHRDVSKHIRNESASTSTTTTSGSNEDAVDTSPDALGYHFNGYNLSEHIPWGGEAPEEKEARAILTVEEGRERIFDAARLRQMGGVGALTDEAMRSLAGE